MGADNYENLGFQVKIDGATDAVNRLDDIIDRLEKIKALEGEKRSKKGSKKSETTKNKEAKQAIDKKTESQKKEEKQAKSTTNALSSYIAKLTSVVMIARQVAHFFTDAVNESAKYVENLNLFAVAFGDAYQENLKWALDLADAYGLASNEVIRFAGTFRELSTSLGLVENTANQVSETVTKLGYDLSALFNTTVEQAMEKLQSGIFSGNVRPLRAFGIDISQNQIDNLFKTNKALAEMGINARNLTQSDKVIARLIIALKSGTDSFGTMAREINNLQSQFRIFEGSLQNFKLAVGDLVEEPISRVMVYVNGLIIAVTDIIRAFKPLQTTDDNNLIDGTAMSAEEASDALDNLNGKLADFDKFNVLGGQSSGNSQLAVTEALNKLLEEQVNLYENRLSTALENIKNEAVEVADKIKDFFIITDENGNFKGWTDNAKVIKEFFDLMSAFVAEGVLTAIVDGIIAITASTANLGHTLSSVGIYFLIKAIQSFVDGKYLDGIAFGVGAIVIGITALNVALKGTLNTFNILSAGIGVLIIGISNLIDAWDDMSSLRKITTIITSIISAVLGLYVALKALSMPLPAAIALGAALGGVVLTIGSQVNVDGFADGGYSNANLIMTHENGKREWVGKAAGSSAIVNDTQMSDIMEVAVAKGVYNALSARSAMGSNVPTNETIVVKIGEEAVFNAVRKTARRQGRDFANV